MITARKTKLEIKRKVHERKTFVLYFLVYIWYNKDMNKNKIFQCDNEVTHGCGYVYSLKYHIVWCTKYRKQIFVNDLESVAAGYIKETAESLDMELVAMEIMPDHVHLLVSCKPQLRLSDAIKVLKGNTARWLFFELSRNKVKTLGWIFVESVVFCGDG